MSSNKLLALVFAASCVGGSALAQQSRPSLPSQADSVSTPAVGGSTTPRSDSAGTAGANAGGTTGGTAGAAASTPSAPAAATSRLPSGAADAGAASSSTAATARNRHSNLESMIGGHAVLSGSSGAPSGGFSQPPGAWFRKMQGAPREHCPSGQVKVESGACVVK